MTDSTSLSSSSSRVWLITGASSGLGLALLLRILSRTTHDRVIATVRVPAKLESALDSRLSQVTDLGENAPRSTSTFASLVEAGRLMALKMDVTESWDDIKAKIQDAIGRWAGRKLDVLVNNAGVGIAGLSEEGGAQVMLEQMKINLFGVINVTNAVLPYMRARREGTIFIVGSRSAWRNERPGIAFYAASKAAVHSYGETLSAELRHFNICVTIIAPGSFHTSAPFDLSSPAGVLVADYTVTREKMAELQRQRSKRLEETGGIKQIRNGVWIS